MRSADPEVARTAISSGGGGQAVAGNCGAGFVGASGLGTDARDRAGTGARGAVGVKILLVHPGASWSTADVFDGLNYGLKENGVQVEHYRLDKRIAVSHAALFTAWRKMKKEEPDLPKPNQADIMYHAGVGALEMALRYQVDVVFVVSAMMLHPDVIVMMKRARLKVVVLFTESPYD